MRRWTYEEVRSVFEENGCKLLSTEYRRSKDKLRYICVCGNEAEIAFDKFKSGQRCRICKAKAIRSSNAKSRRTIEEVRHIFERNGCKLISTEYLNNKQKLLYRCKCGNVARIALTKMAAGQHCSECKGEKIANSQRGKYRNPNRTDEERIKQRKYPEYIAWRRLIYEADDYTCHCCGESGGTLNAHHLRGYAEYPELRTDVNNGVTLCYECHREFHRRYGTRGFTPEDFSEFIHYMTDDRFAIDTNKELYY